MRLGLFLLIGASLGLGCQPGEITPPPFDGARAMSYLKSQTDFGPRVPGSQAWRECRTYYYNFFDRPELSLDSQLFPFSDPYSEAEITMVNIIVSYRGAAADQTPLLFVAHYDSRPRTDFHSDSTLIEEPLLGANDGASGVAVLMELAGMVSESRPEVNVDFLLVDGEDWGKAGDSEYYLLGSNYFATHDGNIRGQYRFAIILDMVGSSEMKIYREGYSERFNPEVNDMIWSVAAKLGVSAFVDSTRQAILDDHMSINVGGVPAVDLIDLDYKYWHTEQDTPDKCSASSLKMVGQVAAYILYNRSVWPEN